MRRALAGACVALAASAAALALVADTAWFGGLLGRRVAALVSEGIEGRVEIESLRPGLRSLEMLGVKAVSPSGARVLSVERARLRWDRWPRAGGDWAFSRLEVEGARVDVDVGSAFEPRSSSAPARPGSSPSISFEEVAIDEAELRNGADPLAEAIAARLRMRIDAEGMQVAGSTSGRLPDRQEPIEVEVDGALSGGWRTMSIERVVLRAGETTASLSVKADLASWTAEVPRIEMHLAAAELASVAPGLSRLDGLRATGRGALADGVARVALSLEQGDANRAQVEGELALLGLGWSVRAASVQVEPASFADELPPATLRGAISIAGAGGEVREVRLDGVELRLEGARAGPIDAAAWREVEGWKIERLAASFPGGSLRASGRLGAEEASLDYRLDVARLESAAAAADALCGALGLSRPELPPVSGDFTITGRIEGRFDAPAIAARLRAPRLETGGVVAADVDLRARVSDLRGRPSARLEGSIGSLGDVEAIGVDLVVRGGRARGRVEGRSPIGMLRARLDAAIAPDLSRVRFESFAFQWPGSTWALVEEATLRLGDVVRAEARFGGPGGGELSGAVSAARGRWRVDARGEGIEVASLPAFLGLDRFGLTGRASFTAQLSEDEHVVEGALEGLDLGGIPGLVGRVAGRAEVRLRSEGKWSAPVLSASLHSSGLEVEGIDDLAAAVRGGWADGAARVEVELSRRGRALASAEARWQGGLDDLASWEALPLRVAASATALDLAEIAPLFAAAVPGIDVSGICDVDLRVEGSAAEPAISLRAAIRGGAWEGRPLGDATVEATSRDGVVAIAARASSAAGGAAAIDASVGVDLGIASSRGPRLADAPVEAQVEVEGAEVGIARILLPSLRQLSGRLDASGRITGTLGDPRAEGAISIRDGRIAHDSIGELREVELELEVEPRRVIVRRLAARSSGTLVATGEATRAADGGDPWALSMRVEASRFGIVSNDLVRAWLDARARVTGTLSSALLDAEIEVEEGTIRLPDRPGRSIQSLEPHPDFRLVGEERGDGVVVAAAAGRAFQVRLHVTNRQPLRLQGIDLAIALNASLRLQHDADGTRLSGAIETTRGNLLVMGRRFDLQRGRVIYLGTEALDAPRLEITAVQESPHAQVTVTIGGTAAKPTADLRSNPPMSEAEIATLLATGRPQLQRGSGGVGEATGAATALGAVVTSQLRRGIAAKLPVDVISVQAGEEGLETGSLEAGSYVTDRIYVGYSRNFGVLETDRRNANEVRVEYQLHRQWTLEVTYGDRGAGDAGVFWRREFR
ncbi:MAG TPA: translocation/assembly module TamB domain-containing protein [Vulgatibacter sp.]|nr:translocation/assembly module TamB domain-containing protein [Vulgatibacter sp.]